MVINFDGAAVPFVSVHVECLPGVILIFESDDGVTFVLVFVVYPRAVHVSDALDSLLLELILDVVVINTRRQLRDFDLVANLSLNGRRGMLLHMLSLDG